MAIVVVCSQCGKSLKAPDQAAGKRARCPGCQTVLTVPAPATKAATETPRPSPSSSPDSAAAPPVRSAPPPRRAAVPPRPSTPPPRPTATPAKAADPWDDDDGEELRLAPPAPEPVPAPWNPAASAPLSLASDSALSAPPALATRRLPATGQVPLAPASPVRSRLYLIFALSLLPLAIFVFQPDDIALRLERTFEANPNLESQEIESEEDLFALLPEGGIEGAHLPRNTWVHWIYAMLSTALFLGAILLLFDTGKATRSGILIVGLFTATFGVLFLLLLQWIAAMTDGVWMRGGNVLVLLFYIVKLIGFAYYAAMDPGTGFWLSLFGFVLGVGLCEELTKAMPVMMRCGKEGDFDWRGACVYGLASGVGFGVAEGILYASDYYNGIHTGSIYLVRFVSCVGLHAIWGASVGMSVYWNQESLIGGNDDLGDYVLSLFKVLGVPMLLHGLYNTLLKHDLAGWSLLMAALSVAWLAWLVESCRSAESEPRGQVAIA